MFAGPEPMAPSKEGEVAKEGDPGRVLWKDTGEAATMPCLAPSSTGPSLRGLCQAHLLQHAARRLILLRQRRTGVTQRHQERQTGWAGQQQSRGRKQLRRKQTHEVGEKNQRESEAEQLWVLPGSQAPGITPVPRVAMRVQIASITATQRTQSQELGALGAQPQDLRGKAVKLGQGQETRFWGSGGTDG